MVFLNSALWLSFFVMSAVSHIFLSHPKAVVDGVIDASIDYESEVVTSGSKNDIYSSSEPQKALHKRISFCLNMHTDVVRAMAYPA